MDFQTLEEKIAEYLLLEDKGIVKLLCATIIANRIPTLDPTWLFVVSSSSGGKSELLLALSHAEGTMPKDDLTSRTFVSGAKGKDGAETSLLFRMPDNPIMIVKDLSVLLKKDSREADAIFSQLRMIYDGTFNKSFGTGEDVDAVVRMGLIAGVTSAIEDYQSDEAAVGQRAIKYYMKQPPEEAINELTKKVLRGTKDKEKREMIGEAFHEFIDENTWDLDNVPELPEDIADDISALSNIATKARSSVKRRQYQAGNPIERANLREMPFRFGKQLANLAKAMIIMNGGDLLPIDRHILYKIALDSIPSGRKQVMLAATKFSEIAVDGLAQETKLPEDSVKMHVDDLVILGVLDVRRVYSAGKAFYFLPDDYRQLIAKFENITMTDEILEEERPELRRTPTPPAPEAREATDEEQKIIGF